MVFLADLRMSCTFFIASIACALSACGGEVETELSKLESDSLAVFDNAPTIVGTLPGEVTVGKSGDAGYQVPLDVAPGSGGLRPHMSIEYNSGGGNGILGVGFSLRGASAIRRSGSVIAIDGVRTPISFGPSDQFILDGQRLMNIDGKHQQDEAEYRTRRESFMRVVYRTSETGDYFVVYGKDGSISEYGRTPDSRIEKAGAVLSWAVNKISDRNGNYMLFTYQHTVDTVGAYSQLLREIHYTGNVKTGTAPYNTVVFHYEDRPDWSLQYLAGFAIREHKRLSKVVMRYDNGQTADNFLWHYRFRYQLAPASGHSRLVEVRKFGADAQGNIDKTSLPGTVFKWPNGTAMTANTLASVESPQLPKFVGNSVVGSGDFDGDGRQDIVMADLWSHGFVRGPSVVVQYGDANRVPKTITLPECVLSHPQPKPAEWDSSTCEEPWKNEYIDGQWTCVGPKQSSCDNFRSISTGDFDGDGLTDIAVAERRLWCEWRQHEDLWNQDCTEERMEVTTIHSGDAGTVVWNGPAGALPHSIGLTREVMSVADFNADGRSDLLIGPWKGYKGDHYAPLMVLRAAGGGQYEQDVTSYSPRRPGVLVVHGDLNGDGLADVIFRRNSSDHHHLKYPWDYTHAFVTSLSPTGAVDFISAGSGESLYGFVKWAAVRASGDFNGDGLSDHITAPSENGYASGSQAWTTLSRGDGTYEQVEIPLRAAGTVVLQGDFNHDGLADFLWGATGDASGRITRDSALYAYLSRGDGTFDIIDNVALPLKEHFGPGQLVSVVATTDLDFDGASEYTFVATDASLQYAHGSVGLTIEVGTDERNLIRAVVNGLGQRTAIEYALLTDDGIYTKGDEAVYPSIDVMAPMTVVRKKTVHGGAIRIEEGGAIVEGSRETQYSYSGARQHQTGYGFLGFASMKIEDVEANTAMTVAFEQNELRAVGMKKMEVVHVGTDLVSNVKNEIGVMVLNGGATSFPYYKSSQEDKYDLGGGIGGGEPYFTSVVSNLERDGSPGFDDYGNVTNTSIRTTANGETRQQDTVNVVHNDVPGWILGQVEDSSVVFSGGDGPPITRRVQYKYYPETGQVRLEFGHDGRVTGHIYDDFGNAIKATAVGFPKPGEVTLLKETEYDALGRVPMAEYNALHHETRNVDVHYGIGKALAIRDANGLQTSFIYDALGGLRRTIQHSPVDADQNLVSKDRRYTPASLPAGWPSSPAQTAVIRVQTASKAPSKLTYRDVLGRELRTAVQGQNGRWVYVDTVYDNQGRVVEKSLPYFSGDAKLINKTQYDVLGRPELVTRADDIEIGYQYVGTQVTETRDVRAPERDELPRVQTTIHNGDNDVVEVIDPAGQHLFLVRDAVGQLVRTVAGQGQNAVTLTRAIYDAAGRRKRVWDSSIGRKSFRYDRLGRQVLTVTWTGNYNEVDGLGEATLVELDLLGRPVRRTTGVGTFHSNVASAAGATAFAFEGSPRVSTFGYDDQYKGVVDFAKNSRVHRLYSYDEWARPSGVRLQMASLEASLGHDSVGQVNSGVELRHVIGYDEWGRRAVEKFRQTFPDNTDLGSVHYYHDDISLLTGVGGRHPGDTTPSDIVTNTIYDASGRLRSSTYANGLVNTFDYYEETGRMKAARVGTVADLDATDSTVFVYDAQGNLTERTRRTPGAQEVTGYFEKFTYDVLDRLDLATNHQLRGEVETSFSTDDVDYDRFGNIRKRTITHGNDSTRAIYDYTGSVHRVQTVTTQTLVGAQVTDSAVRGYQYDPRGQITMRGGDAVTWTRFGRPKRIHSGATSLTFSYDAHGNRIRQVVRAGEEVTRIKTYLGPLETDQSANGALVSARVFASTPAGPVAVMEYTPSGGTERRYLHTDHLGSITSVTGKTGAVMQRLQFDAWGRPRTQHEDPEWTYLISYDGRRPIADRGFTGHEMLTEAKLVHMNARVYDPAIGRFLSPDGYVQAPTNLQNYNRYSYVLNQPLSLTDPTGNFFFVPAVLAAVQATLVFAVKAALYLVTHPGVALKVWGLGTQLAKGDYAGAIRGLAFSAIVPGLTNGVGAVFKPLAEKAAGFVQKSLVELARAATHGVVRGGLAEAQGDNFRNGAIAGTTASLLDSAIGGVQTNMGLDPGEFRPAENIAVGLATGTVSELTGGKFANGFATGTSINRYNKAGDIPGSGKKGVNKVSLADKLGAAIKDPTAENVAAAAGATLAVADDYLPPQAQLVTSPIAATIGAAGDSSTVNATSHALVMGGSQVVASANIIGKAYGMLRVVQYARLATPLGVGVQGILSIPSAFKAVKEAGGLINDIRDAYISHESARLMTLR